MGIAAPTCQKGKKSTLLDLVSDRVTGGAQRNPCSQYHGIDDSVPCVMLPHLRRYHHHQARRSRDTQLYKAAVLQFSLEHPVTRSLGMQHFVITDHIVHDSCIVVRRSTFQPNDTSHYPAAANCTSSAQPDSARAEVCYLTLLRATFSGL